MDAIETSLGQLIEAIRNDEAYINYQKCRSRLAELPEAAAEVSAFRQDTIAYAAQPESTDLQAYAEHFSERFERLLKNPEIAAFLDAEEALVRTVRAVENGLYDSLDLAIPGYPEKGY